MKQAIFWSAAALVHLYLGGKHILGLVQDPTLEHLWKGPGALLGALIMLLMAHRSLRRPR